MKIQSGYGCHENPKFCMYCVHLADHKLGERACPFGFGFARRK